MFKWLVRLHEKLDVIDEGFKDWREHVDIRTENNLNAAGSTMQRIVMEEVAKLKNSHDNILGNIHTLQVRLHNLDVKMNMILDGMPKAIESKAKKMKKAAE